MSGAQANDETCVICLEGLEKPQTLYCHGIFCRACILNWYARNPTCPLCRNSFSAIIDVNTNQLSFLRAPSPVLSEITDTDDEPESEGHENDDDAETEFELDLCVRCKKTAALLPDDGFTECPGCHSLICLHCGGPFDCCPSCALGDVDIEGVENELRDNAVETWPGFKTQELTGTEEIFRAEVLVVIEMMTSDVDDNHPISTDTDERKRLRRALLAPVRVLYEHRHQNAHTEPLVRARDSFRRGIGFTPEFVHWYYSATENVATAVADMFCAAGVRVRPERVAAIATENIRRRQLRYGW